MAAVTCRTEYLTARHLWGARGAWITLLVGLVAFVVLGIVDAEPSTTALLVFGAVALSLISASWGRLGKRGAFIVALDRDTITLGCEGERLVDYPRSMLDSLTVEGPADRTSTSGRNLTVAGLKYLVLDFSDHSYPGAQIEQWHIGVVDTDPAVAALIHRLSPERTAQRTAAAGAASGTARKKAPATAASTTAGPRVAAATFVGTANDTGSTDPEPEKVDLNKRPDGPGERITATDSAYDAPSIATAGSEAAAERLWEAAVVRHNAILRDYGTYELQPELMLRFPAVTDITLPPVQDFHDALADAQALRTEKFPDDDLDVAIAYQDKVKALSRAWIACETAGRRVGTDYLGADEKDGLDTALKLVNHARGGGATPMSRRPTTSAPTPS